MTLLSCKTGMKGYVKYQTFDEYRLEGVGNPNIKCPYVFVKKEFDTIFVIKSNERKKVITYINRGNYWYSKSIIEVKPPSFAFGRQYKLDMTPTVYEKFIYNDTVIEYRYQYHHQYKKTENGYLIDSLKRTNRGIFVHTKKDCIILSIQYNDIKNYDDPFKEIKEFVTNYKEIFPLYSPGYQPRCFSMYEKQIKGNVFSVYEVDGINRKFVKSKKMNSLGEFDNKGMLMWW